VYSKEHYQCANKENKNYQWLCGGESVKALSKENAFAPTVGRASEALYKAVSV
jgi:hypothetical protein